MESVLFHRAFYKTVFKNTASICSLIKKKKKKGNLREFEEKIKQLEDFLKQDTRSQLVTLTEYTHNPSTMI